MLIGVNFVKSCNVCKTVVKDNDNFCTFCGSKIQSLSELIQEKRNEMLLNDNKESIDNFNNGFLSTEVRKFKKNRRTLVLSLIFLLIAIFLGLLLGNQIDGENVQSENVVIESQLDKNDYENVYNNGNNVAYKQEQENLFDGEFKPINEMEYNFQNNKGMENTQEYLTPSGNVSEKVSMSVERFLQFYNATDSLKMDRDKILFTSLVRDLNGKDLCKFVYNAHQFTASYGDNDKLLYIMNSFGEKVFEDGQVIKSIEEFLVSYEDMLNISKISKMIINLIHDEPTISKFPSIINQQYLWNITVQNDLITVVSYVDHRSEKGGKIRENFKIILKKDGSRYKIVDLIFNGEKSEKIIY